MAVSLSGLPGLPAFDAVGEPATLAQRWLTWKDEFELYVTASGISDPTQKRALLLHLAGPKVRDVFNNSIPHSRSMRRSERLQKSYGLPLGTLQTKKEHSDCPTNIFGGYSISR